MKTQTAPRIRKRVNKKDFKQAVLLRKIEDEECNHVINKGVNIALFTKKKIGTTFYFSIKEVTNYYDFDDPRTIKVSVRLKPNYRGPVCLIPKDAIMVY
jgi:hypothetical protein